MTASAIEINLRNDLSGLTEIGSDMFGGIYTTFQHKSAGLQDYDLHATTLGLTHLRWPGGTFAKSKKDEKDWDGDGNVDEFAYDLANPDVNLKADGTGNPEFGLSGALEYALAKGQSFSMVIPVERYMEDLEGGEKVLDQFLHRLLVEKEFGDLPADFTLELGNENIVVGDVESAMDYGAVANAFTTVISSHNSNLPSGVEPLKIAIQGGKDFDTDAAIREQISPENYDSVDSIIFHYLSINIRNLQAMTSEREVMIKDWEDAIGDDVEIFASAWTVGVAGYPESSNHDYIDAGAEAARTTLESIVAMSQTGVDKAAVWGVDINLDGSGSPYNPNWFSSGENWEVQLSHAGHALRMMAESLPGTSLIHVEGNQAAPGQVENGHMPGLDSVSKYVFQGDGELVVFLAANDVPDVGEVVSIDVSSFAESGTIEVSRLTNAPNGSPTTPFDDVAELEVALLDFENGSIDVPVTEDFEFIRVTMNFDPEDVIGNPSEKIVGTGSDDRFTVYEYGVYIDDPSTLDNDLILSAVNFDLSDNALNVERLELMGSAQLGFGDALSNSIYGNDLANQLSGGPGDDRLTGARGDDTLLGGDGHDSLIGGFGRDFMQGGSGDDLYFLDDVADRILEFQDGGNDTIVANLDLELWRYTRDVENVRLSQNGGDLNAFGNRLDNQMTGNAGSNDLWGGRGDDLIRGWGGDDYLYGGPGNDEIAGNKGDDWIYGGAGDDLIRGNLGNDTLHGGAGSDFISAGSGINKVSGGSEADTFSLQNFGSSLTIVDYELGIDRLLFDTAHLGMSQNQVIDALFLDDVNGGLQLSLNNGHGSDELNVLISGASSNDRNEIMDSVIF